MTDIAVKVKAIRKLVRDTRKALGITQEQLAISAKLNQPLISRIETDRNAKINLVTLEKVAKVLKMHVALDLILDQQDNADGSIQNTRD